MNWQLSRTLTSSPSRPNYPVESNSNSAPINPRLKNPKTSRPRQKRRREHININVEHNQHHHFHQIFMAFAMTAVVGGNANRFIILAAAVSAAKTASTSAPLAHGDYLYRLTTSSPCFSISSSTSTSSSSYHYLSVDSISAGKRKKNRVCTNGNVMKIRGGASSSVEDTDHEINTDDDVDDAFYSSLENEHHLPPLLSEDVDFDDIDDEVSAEELLDSLFLDDDENDFNRPIVDATARTKPGGGGKSMAREHPNTVNDGQQASQNSDNGSNEIHDQVLEESIKQKSKVIHSNSKVRRSRTSQTNIGPFGGSETSVSSLDTTSSSVQSRGPAIKERTEGQFSGAASNRERVVDESKRRQERDLPGSQRTSHTETSILTDQATEIEKEIRGNEQVPRVESTAWNFSSNEDMSQFSQSKSSNMPNYADKSNQRKPNSTFLNAKPTTITTSSANFRNHSSTPDSEEKGSHAVWGPHAYYRKAPSKPPPMGPSPAKATDEERRAHESENRAREDRKRLLSSLAMSLQDSHTSVLQALIRGNAAHIPPELFGETITQEKSACNEKFFGSMTEIGRGRESSSLDYESTVLGEDIDSPPPSFRHIEDPALLSYWGLTPNAKLYGGAQYHRVLRYYHHLFLTVPLPPITDNEVALLTNGITEVHDASDLMRAVALLVRHKMELVMEDVLEDMTRRVLYVLDRQWEMVQYSMTLHRPVGGHGLSKVGEKSLTELEFRKRHWAEYNALERDLTNVLTNAFHKFAEEKAADAYAKCVEDVRSLLRYVTWDMGRARKRDTGTKRNEDAFQSQIEIVRTGTTVKKGKKDQNASSMNNGSDIQSVPSEFLHARGGAVGSGRTGKRRGNNNRLRSHNKSDERLNNDEDMGDLIGGVMNRGKEDDDTAGNGYGSTSLVVSSRTSPMFSGDDEVLTVLLDTVSSTLVPKSELQASRTQAAITNLVSYVTDRMRMDMSRMIRGKFNTFFLLAFHEELGTYLRKELEDYLSSLQAA
ncbi:hypothetical protein ACHAXS_006096 [Conticribra weissflogii]